MYSKGAICLSRLLFKMGLFTVYSKEVQAPFFPFPFLQEKYFRGTKATNSHKHWFVENNTIPDNA
jgi:hypothetical protein